jgi:CubicO group peptidase (beta-lactamase class C family)
MLENMTLTAHNYDFTPVHQAMRRYVEANLLPGVSSAVLVGRDLVDLHCVGWADKERDIPLGPDHIFRVFSNTKLITSCAVLLLLEEGLLQLNDPIENYIPQIGHRRVLKPGATAIEDTVPADGSITIRHLLSHSSGLSYGLLDPGTTIYKAYHDCQVLNQEHSLGDMIEALADLPLVFQPGTGWEYSVATDVLSRLVEILSGRPFDAFIRQRILDPLGMADTGFWVPPHQHHRFTAFYAGADLTKPMKPGLTRIDDYPYPQAYLRPFPLLSGGGGLVSTLPDMVALLRSLLPGGPTLLKPETISLIMTNQLPEGVWVRFPAVGNLRGYGYGLAGMVTLKPSSIDPQEATGEFQWGGIGGTHWWISPNRNLTGILMTQREMAFLHPFSFEFKRSVYRAVSRA